MSSRATRVYPRGRALFRNRRAGARYPLRVPGASRSPVCARAPRPTRSPYFGLFRAVVFRIPITASRLRKACGPRMSAVVLRPGCSAHHATNGLSSDVRSSADRGLPALRFMAMSASTVSGIGRPAAAMSPESIAATRALSVRLLATAHVVRCSWVRRFPKPCARSRANDCWSFALADRRGPRGIGARRDQRGADPSIRIPEGNQA